jgi:hypothetical protein
LERGDVNQDLQDFQDQQDSQILTDYYDRHRQVKTNNEGTRQDSAAIFERELKSGVPSSLSVAEYLSALYEYREPYPVRMYPEWQSPMWEFARLAKAHPSIGMLSGSEAADVIEKHMKGWPRPGESESIWEDLFPDAGGAEDVLSDFMHSWDRVRFLPGTDPLGNALRKAEACPLQPPIRRGEGFARFISLAGWLQVFPDGPIMLPVEKLGKLLGVEPRTISRYRQWAVEDGLLQLVKPHDRPNGRATEFRFAVDRFPELQREVM